MIAQDHLQIYTLTLTTHGPLHIGSGQTMPRKEYILDSKKATVYFLREQKFFDLLIRNGLVDLFEGFCMRNGGDLYSFLHGECGLNDAQIAPAVLYQVSAGDALDADHTLKDISRFMRDNQGRAYIPGSSIKGALRTALLYHMIADDDPRSREASISRIAETPAGKYRRLVLPEEQYLNKLKQDKKYYSNAVNSIMRGIQLSDSEPISDRTMTLVMKYDGFTAGGLHSINVCRECVAPGVDIRFRLTLDQSILINRITIKTIMDAINAFAAYYRQAYEKYFTKPYGLIEPGTKNILYLGGGSGFFSKSLAYPYLGRTQGLDFVVRYLSSSFKSHRHEQDRALGISPRTLKYGKYGQRIYSFGACEVSIT